MQVESGQGDSSGATEAEQAAPATPAVDVPLRRADCS